MKKFLKWTVGILIVLFLLFQFVIWPFVLKPSTKKHSPEQTITQTIGDSDITVYYNRPFKKGRKVFDSLVPYGKVWRTGANEPSTFETTEDLIVGGEPLPAGKYSLWTIPNKDSWEVIFNNKMYDWGVTFSSGGSETPREPEADVANVIVATQQLTSPVEQFTITLEGNALNLMWDRTKVSVPIE
ncbi:DUF2911 domain-containing protein [Sungkyunkwania multivorans]|uniref:DUF2911 domain-containing protein n=1 Tax=Sungkyunkwania multivorans TaxID=1173618 RepID=A0ABW3CXK9_9FLAO